MIADLAMQRALDRYHAAGISGLTEEEKTLATLWCFESKVANGGFENFYRATEGELAPYAPAAFRNVGAETLADIAERANAVFGPAGVPRSRDARREFLDQLASETRQLFDKLQADYEAVGVDLDERIEAYVVRAGTAPRLG